MKFAVLLGALIGFAIARVDGLIIGALAGYLLPKILKHQLLSGARKARSPFIETTFSVMGAVCKADGRVSEQEIRVAETLFDRFRLDEQARQLAIHAFNRGKQAGFDLDAEVAHFRQISRGQRVLHLIFLQVQLSAMMADGRVTPAEHQMLLRIARGLGISEAEIRGLEATLTGNAGAWNTGGTYSRAGWSYGGSAGPRAASHGDLAEAYATIGVKPSDSNDTIKRAYRRLMSENHPDKLAAKGLPESMLEIAKRKTQEITAAYRIIEQARAAHA